jgi:uncharacterized protein
MTREITVQNSRESRTYDALVDGEVVGMIVYELKGSQVIISHTIVEPEHRGEGIASALVHEALDDIRAKDRTLSNYCGFVATYIENHPQYQDLIDLEHPGMKTHP